MLIDGHFIGGPCDQSIGKAVQRSPYDGQIVGTVAEGFRPEADAALDCAVRAFGTWRRSPRHERQTLLRRIAHLVRERSDELADLLVHEIGKPVTWAEGEVSRMALTFELAASELDRWGLEELPVDFDPRGKGYRCTVERFPIGVILGIVPYNWPFNLAAHKIAPALAAGNTIVLKPSTQAALSTLTLARLIHDAGCPPGVLNAVNCPAEVAQWMAQDQRVAMLSFTGSPAVGWKLKELLHAKRVSLELGGDASAIVCEDADLEWTLSRLVPGGYGYAGQICISIQHVLAHESVYEEVRERLIAGTQRCPAGDPALRETVCGPLISPGACEKVLEWVEEARAAGAQVLVGGTRQGNVVAPTLVEDVPPHVRLGCEEVFGPVLTLRSFKNLDEALERVNDSKYGIHCGVFTRSRQNAERAFQELEVSGVIINDYPTLRFDNMPYGGVKRSGFGREGVRYAMDEMSEPKVRLTRTQD